MVGEFLSPLHAAFRPRARSIVDLQSSVAHPWGGWQAPSTAKTPPKNLKKTLDSPFC